MTIMKNNYLLVHGSFGSLFSNWMPWLRSELEKENLEVYTPDFPTGVGYQNLEDIKNYCNERICYYSDNDPYVKYDVEKYFADSISTEQYCIHNGGHLNAESNYIEFKELLSHK